MRYAAIILGIIAVTFLLPQNAFARGGKAQKENQRREARREVPPVVTPVIVERNRRAPVVVERTRRAPVVVERTRKAPVVVVEKSRPQPVVVRERSLRRHAPGPIAVRHADRRPHHGQRGYARPQGHRHHAESRPQIHRHHVGSRPQIHRHHAGSRPQIHRHHGGCGWIDGHYEGRSREVYVPGYFRNEVVPPVYVERRGPRGVCLKIMVRPAGLRKVWVAPTTMRRTEQVWVPGHYRCGR